MFLSAAFSLFRKQAESPSTHSISGESSISQAVREKSKCVSAFQRQSPVWAEDLFHPEAGDLLQIIQQCIFWKKQKHFVNFKTWHYGRRFYTVAGSAGGVRLNLTNLLDPPLLYAPREVLLHGGSKILKTDAKPQTRSRGGSHWCELGKVHEKLTCMGRIPRSRTVQLFLAGIQRCMRCIPCRSCANL